MANYGQFCPVAKAMEVLDERWTLLVVRELLQGSTHFNELRRGLPRMSPTLLSKRLVSLERAGVVRREAHGRATSYELTDCGRDLTHAVQALGLWGLRWVGDLGEEDLDPHLLMWDIKRTMPSKLWPPGRSVVRLTFSDVASRSSRWWVVVREGEVDICDFDPGHEVAARVDTTLRVLTRVWRAEMAWPDAVRAGTLRVDGAGWIRAALPGWFGVSGLASLAMGEATGEGVSPASA